MPELLLLLVMLASAHAQIEPAGLVVLPNSTLLPLSTALVTVQILASDLAAAQCRFSQQVPVPPYHEMTNFSACNATACTTVVALPGNVTDLTTVTVLCAAWMASPVTRVFRQIAAANPSFPRTGNLWGSYNFATKPLSYAASHIDLWLGATWTRQQLATLRALNPNTLALTSINAVEYGDGLPEAFYLHNISGSAKKDRCEVWPGAYRLDMTKDFVAQWHAAEMYQLVLRGGSEGDPALNDPISLLFDGIFVDNVFPTQSWLKEDINGNPFFPDPDGTGKPMDPTEFDALWRAGVLLELRLFRQQMPFALMSGHAMDPTDADIAALFNAISIGFDMPNVIENHLGFSQAWADYENWFILPVAPRITMMESAIFLQIGYGYGFDTQIMKGSIPASTLEFAKDFFSYMRFGLAFTLMNDGYFAHEIGDSFHGQDWWYDELQVDLGYPLGPAAPALPRSPGPEVEFPTLANAGWALWVDPSTPCQASLSFSTSAAVAEVNVTRAPLGQSAGSVDFFHENVNLTAGVVYTLSFAARASVNQTVVGLNARRSGGDWASYGLSGVCVVSDTWQNCTASFTATATDPMARLSFWLGAPATHGAPVVVSIGNISLGPGFPPCFQRAFTNGLVIVNGDTQARVVPVPPGYRRINGTQAPKWQLVIDDASPAFSTNRQWSTVSIEGGYSLAAPTSEENSGPYFHQWATSCRTTLAPNATATWSLVSHFFDHDTTAVVQDQFTFWLWWPALPTASSAWSAAVLVQIIQPESGKVLASAELDQRRNGDTWNIVAANVTLESPGAVVVLTCSGTDGRLCVADALRIESASRFNDGTPVVGNVTLAAKDGIVLLRSDATI